jgi:hypothetical protein
MGRNNVSMPVRAGTATVREWTYLESNLIHGIHFPEHNSIELFRIRRRSIDHHMACYVL